MKALELTFLKIYVVADICYLSLVKKNFNVDFLVRQGLSTYKFVTTHVHLFLFGHVF